MCCGCKGSGKIGLTICIVVSLSLITSILVSYFLFDDSDDFDLAPSTLMMASIVIYGL